MKAIIININKTYWMLWKIEAMIEKSKDEIEIMQQVNATIWLLKSVNNKLLKQYLLETWAKALSNKDSKKSEKAANEILKAVDISTRK